jgi:RNA polymerase sigma factor (sigma-70 family)
VSLAILEPPVHKPRLSAVPRPATVIPGASDDPVRDYLQKISKIPLLNAEEEPQLARAIEAGLFAQEKLDKGVEDDTLRRELKTLVAEGEAAYRRFVRANLRLVVSVAKNHLATGVPFMDLIQEGNIGLDRAVKKFDYRKGYKFSTYATWWIKQSVSRGVADSGRLIRLPVHASEKASTVRKVIREFQTDMGRKPTILEIADATGFSVENVRLFLEADRDPISLHTPVGDDAGSEFGELIEDGDGAPVIDIVSAGIRHDLLHKKLNGLPKRDAEVLRLRFGLTNGTPMTFDQVGARLGVSRERIRQIEQRALRALRCPELHGQLGD